MVVEGGGCDVAAALVSLETSSGIFPPSVGILLGELTEVNTHRRCRRSWVVSAAVVEVREMAILVWSAQVRPHS